MPRGNRRSRHRGADAAKAAKSNGIDLATTQSVPHSVSPKLVPQIDHLPQDQVQQRAAELPPIQKASVPKMPVVKQLNTSNVASKKPRPQNSLKVVRNKQTPIQEPSSAPNSSRAQNSTHINEPKSVSTMDFS